MTCVVGHDLESVLESPFNISPTPKSPMPKHLPVSTVQTIKQRIWNGELLELIAASVGCSESLVGNIASGHKWSAIPWPDGSIGALPTSQRNLILTARKEARHVFNEAVIKLIRKAHRSQRKTKA